VIWELNLGVRLGLLAVLSLFTVWYTARGIQNGIWFLLVTMMWNMNHATIFPSAGGLPNITLDRVVLPLVLAVFVLQYRKGKVNRYPPDLIEYCMCILIVVILLSQYMNETYTTSRWGGERLQFFQMLSGFGFPFVCYSMMRRLVLTRADIVSFLTGMGLITIYLALTSLGEAWHQSWLVFPKYILDPKVGDHVGYARGPFLNATWNGVSMVMGVPILVWLFFGRRGASRLLWLLGLALVGLSLPYVFQRAVWLGAAAAVVVTALAWPRRRLLLIGAVLLIAAVGSLASPQTLEDGIKAKLARTETIYEYRLPILERTVAIINDHLLTGVGFTRFDQELLKHRLPSHFTTHNTPLTLFAELGLLGFLPYLSIFILLLLESAKAYWRLPGSRVLVGGMWGITAAYVIVMMAGELRYVAYINAFFYALWAMLLAMIRRQSIPQQEPNPAYYKVVSFV